jgi:ATP-binding cassette, subfamily C, bacterial LapB
MESRDGMGMTDAEQLDACLQHLAGYWGLAVSTDPKIPGEDDEPMSQVEIERKAEHYGLRCALVRSDLEATGDGQFPALFMVGPHRPIVVLEKLDDNRWMVFDPHFGADPVVLTTQDLQAGTDARILSVRPVRSRPGSCRHGEDNKHWFIGALSANRWTYVQIILAAALTNFLGLSTSIFIMVVYDRVLPNEAIDSLIALTVGVGIALLFDFLIKMLRSAFIEKAGQSADIRLGQRIFGHLLDLKMSSGRGTSGGLANTLREFESLRDFFASATLAAVVDLPFILLFVWVIYLIGGPLALVPLLAVPLVLAVGLLVQPFLQKLSSESFEQGQSKQNVLVETLSGLESIKSAGAYSAMQSRWSDALAGQSELARRGRGIQQFAMNATMSTQQLAQVAIVVYGVFLVGDGVISMGAMIASVILTGRALAPLAQLAQTMTRINQARTSYRAIDQLMALPRDHSPEQQFLSRPVLNGKLELRNITFRYPDQSNTLIGQLDLVIEPGEKVAIVGRVGSGKSTLARLLAGLYEPEDGAVLIDDTDIRQIDPSDLRKNLGCVLQEPWILSGTLRENISLGGYQVSDADVLSASRKSCAHDFIAKLPSGYDTVVGEKGEGLSGGQKQQVCIARALAEKRSVLILDEPTSAMDPQTEKQIIAELKAITGKVTLIVITHRPSLLALADRVVVMESGAIVADGPRHQVMKPVSAASAGSA